MDLALHARGGINRQIRCFRHWAAARPRIAFRSGSRLPHQTWVGANAGRGSPYRTKSRTEISTSHGRRRGMRGCRPRVTIQTFLAQMQNTAGIVRHALSRNASFLEFRDHEGTPPASLRDLRFWVVKNETDSSHAVRCSAAGRKAQPIQTVGAQCALRRTPTDDGSRTRSTHHVRDRRWLV